MKVASMRALSLCGRNYIGISLTQNVITTLQNYVQLVLCVCYISGIALKQHFKM